MSANRRDVSVQQRRDALSKLKKPRAGTSTASPTAALPTSSHTAPGRAGAPRLSAATSHVLSEQYMERMEDAFVQMGVQPAGRHKPLPRAAEDVAAESVRQQLPDGPALLPKSTPAGQWKSGPTATDGTLIDLSERPLLCMDVHPASNCCVIGGSDHALYEIDLLKKRKRRTLYTKTQGHAEWVTTVAYGPDGRILSGAMDNTLLLWDNKVLRSTTLIGHTGSISQVAVSADGTYGVSSSYDKTLRCWSLTSRRPIESGCLQGHRAPVLCFAWGNSSSRGEHSNGLLSGARDGSVIHWDLNRAKATYHVDAHQGHVTSLCALGPQQGFLSGGQDGLVKLWDYRANGKDAVHSLKVHTSPRGSGAVGDIKVSSTTGMNVNQVVTMGADGNVCVLNMRMNQHECVHKFEEHKDFIYSLHIHGDLVLSGSGDGHLHIHDLSSMSLLYGLGANEAAVRAIGCTGDTLIAAGDDGNVIMYDF